MYQRIIKPTADFLAAFLGLIILLPLFATITILLAFANDGNPFFIQLRPGRHGKIFRLIKFRTMGNQRDARGELLPDADRLTRVGMFVRKTSLDELPQLLNVLLGHMSLVGPRPLLPEYLPLYSPEQSKRHLVKPGITGWAQVKGRNAISWQQKFELDLWYIRHQSFFTDLKILCLTVAKVLKQEGISQEGRPTIEKFTGNP